MTGIRSPEISIAQYYAKLTDFYNLIAVYLKDCQTIVFLFRINPYYLYIYDLFFFTSS